MKLLEGDWGYGRTVKIQLDNGKVIFRKVRYDSLNGMYVVIDNEKISYKTLTKEA
jgi:hypothetical protein